MEEPDAMEVMQKASSHDRHLATIRPPQPIHLSKGDITLNFQSAVPTFGPEGNYIALLHPSDNRAPFYNALLADEHLWHALRDYELFCSGPGKSHRVRMRILGEEGNLLARRYPGTKFTGTAKGCGRPGMSGCATCQWPLIWLCDWPQEEAHAGSYQVFFEEADGTEIGHLNTSYDPMLLKKYDNVACVTSAWPGTRGLSDLPQWLEYSLINGVDHFLVYTMTGTDERVMDIYKPYLNDGLATRVHLEIPDRLSGEYQAEGYSTQRWLANDCLYRMKNHAKWMSPTIDVDEYVRLNHSLQVQDGPRASWDSIESEISKDNANTPNVHSLSFGRAQFLRAQGTGAIQISSSMRREQSGLCPKYVVKPALVNALCIHAPVSWVAGSVGLIVPHQLGRINHYREEYETKSTKPAEALVKDPALVTEAPAVMEAIQARFKSKWESLATKWGAMQLMEFTMQGKESEEDKLSMERSRLGMVDFNNIDQIEISIDDSS